MSRSKSSRSFRNQEILSCFKILLDIIGLIALQIFTASNLMCSFFKTAMSAFDCVTSRDTNWAGKSGRPVDRP